MAAPPMSLDRYAEAARRIPAGETRSFAALAAMAGRPGAARAAGRAIANQQTGSRVPWHRVVAADGALARDAGRAREQRRRLRREGARPRAREGVRSWAGRVGAAFVASYPHRRYAPADDARIDDWDRDRVEPLADRASAEARGFRALDALAGQEQAPLFPKPSPARRRRARGSTRSIAQRLASADWERASEELPFDGWRRIPALLTAGECAALVEHAARHPDHFERTVDMAPRGFGVGAYHYFREPLPEPAGTLRALLYERLQPVANAHPWRGGGAPAYPSTLESFWDRCRAAGQRRGSSILLCYGPGGVNYPHRDIYGPEWFPLQALVVLSRRGRDFDGGELVLTEETSSGDRRRIVEVTEGDLVVFGSRLRWERGQGKTRRVALRHGMDPVRSGERHALGIVFHLAA